MTEVALLLDEHVGRVFERVLSEYGYDVAQAKGVVGGHTSDPSFLRWCREHDRLLVTNNAKDLEPRHESTSHAGILLYREQSLPDRDPEGLARAARAVVDQYGTSGVENELVSLDEWYDWLQG